MTKKSNALIGMLVVFAVLSSLFIYQWLHPDYPYPEARGGVLDARQWDFERQGIVPLRGEWEFYENRLLTPQDFRTDAAQLAEESRFLPVPGGWKGDFGDGYGAGTYRLRVQVSEPELYSLRGKKIRMSSRIYMDDSDLGGTGQPGMSAEQFTPSNLPFFGTIQANADTVDIIVQVASYDYLEGGLVQAPEFGLTADVTARVDNARLADMIVVTTMLVFAVYYAGMFRQWRKEPYLLFFSLFCLSIGLFFGIDNEILMATLFPEISFLLLQKLLFLLPCMAILFFTLYVYTYIDNRMSHAVRWLRRIAYLYLGLIIMLPNAYLVDILWSGILLQIMAFAFILLLVFRNRSRGVHVYSILLGVFFAMISWLYAQTRYQLALDNPYYMIVTPLLLVLSQSLLMSERAREAYLRSERLAEELMANDRQKDEFLVHTSHEFKTPLHSIINLAQVVTNQSGDKLAQRQRANLEYIIAQAVRLSTQVNDIIDYQRLRRGSLTFQNRLFDVSGTIQATLESLQYLRKHDEVRLINQVQPGTAYLNTDENRLKQILVNLIGNALKFTERGSITVAAASEEGWMCLTFRDTGTGMSEERRRLLLTDAMPDDSNGGPAASMQPSSGLGLRISKALATQMGGDLELQWSEPGQGSVFVLRLPKASAAPIMEEAEAGPGTQAIESAPIAEGRIQHTDEPHNEAKILLVDDDVSNIKVLQEILAPSRYRLLVAYDGASALKLIASHRDISLVLLDVMMPGLSGYEVCRRIRGDHPIYQLPVLLLTVRHSAADVAAGLEAGANDFLTKPFDGQELLARVRTLLQLREAVEQAVRIETLYLQSQIKPHFIYNALSGIISLCYSDGPRAGKLLGEFSNYLRLSFDLDPHHAKISLSRELSLVKSYVELEKARFGDRLQVDWHAEVSQETLIPALIIQPLVENAIRHGLMKRLSGGTVRIQAESDHEGLRIAVQDDGVGIPKQQLETMLTQERMGGSIGLINVHRRLMNEYGQGLQIESVQGEGTKVTIRIPSLGGRQRQEVNGFDESHDRR